MKGVIIIKAASCLLGLGLFVALILSAHSGSLEPTASPAPTMKTLDEVEARIPIPGSATPTGTFNINESGSYYLTGNRYASGYGITVNTDHVSIDLNGYSLIGPGGSSYGIYMRTRGNVEIHNGTVRGFYRGIYESDSSGNNHRVINVRAVSNTLEGIHLIGSKHLVKDCTASKNGTSASGDVYGINVGTGCIVTGSIASDNGDFASGDVYGINVGTYCKVTGNTANDNGDSATGTAYGIYVATGCTITGNTACSNGQGATGFANGIHVYVDCLVNENIAYNNGGQNMNFGAGGSVYVNNVAP